MLQMLIICCRCDGPEEDKREVGSEEQTESPEFGYRNAAHQIGPDVRVCEVKCDGTL